MSVALGDRGGKSLLLASRITNPKDLAPILLTPILLTAFPLGLRALRGEFHFHGPESRSGERSYRAFESRVFLRVLCASVVNPFPRVSRLASSV